MGYELTYEDGKFYVWSTIVDDYISGPLDSPHRVAMFIVNKGRDERFSEERPPVRDKKAMEIYRIWYDEAERIKRYPEEGLQIVATMGGFREGEPYVVKYEEPVRMTPKLKELQRKQREGKE